MSLVLFFGIIVGVVLVGGIISGLEAALLSISTAKVKERKNEAKTGKERRKAESLLGIKNNLQDYITTVVVLTNAINIVGSVFIGSLAAEIFGSSYVGVVSAVVTFLIIMFSEIVPKLYGEKYALKFSMTLALPLVYFTWFIKPLIKLLNLISSVFVKGGNITSVSEGEIKEMASMSHEKGSINSYEKKIINRVFSLNDIEAKGIMVPRKNISFVDKDMSMNKISNLVEETGFTRFPVRDKGEVVGIINAKDVLKFKGSKAKFSVSKILRPIIFVPESTNLLELERRMKKERTHMAGVVNEHGDFIGIVTLELLIEELIGENIKDEFDSDDEEKIKKLTQNKYEVQGDCRIKVINEKLGLDLPTKERYKTLNGYMNTQLDKIPRINDRVKESNATIRVIETNKEGVKKAKVLLKKNKT